MVLADTPKGITIDECVSISRAIEHNLDREVEDFELEVSSPGLLQPFKVTEQYKKYTDKHVDVVLKTGQKLSGKLISSTESGFVLETKDKRKTVAKKKPEVVIEQHALAYEEVKSTILVVIF